MTDVKRVSTGVAGMDELVGGGFPDGSVTLVSGGAGCGKTIFCSQFLWEGLQNGENCRFITLEEGVNGIKSDAKLFGWDFEKHDDSFDITYIKPSAGERGFMEKVNDLVSGGNVSRLAIDSISIMLGAYGGGDSEKRDNLYRLIRHLKRSDATTVMTSEILESQPDALSRYGVAEFVSDGVIVFYYSGVGEGTFRNVEVRKMRKTAHTPGTYPFKIGDNGIEVIKEATL